MFKWFKFGLAGITGIFVLVGIIIGIAVTIIFNLYVEKQKQVSVTSPSSPATTEEVEKPFIEEESFDESNNSHVQAGILTKENFDRLQAGMSYKKTVKTLGTEGRKESERINQNTHSITYQFAEKGYKGIDISVSFLNGELSHKSFYSGVPGSSEIAITAAQFDEVKTGMTYEEIKKVIGGEGILRSDYGFPDGDYHSQTYTYDGRPSYSEAVFTFSEGELTSKSQNNLD